MLLLKGVCMDFVKRIGVTVVAVLVAMLVYKALKMDTWIK